MPKESLKRKIVFQENLAELCRNSVYTAEQTGDSSEIVRAADKLGDVLKELAELREKNAAVSGRRLADEIARRILMLANGKRQSPRALAAHSTTELQTEDANREGAEHGWNN